VADVLNVSAHGIQYITTVGGTWDGDETVGADVDTLRWSVHTTASSRDQRWSVIGVRGMGNTRSEFCTWVDHGMVTTATVEDG
jgi:hypothetical protein